MNKNYLDELKEAYDDTFPYALDNRLILNWYPTRILCHARGDALLELGVGHGFCSLILSQYFKRHVIIEGSKEIIERFKLHPEANQIEVVHTFFEEYHSEEKFDVIVMGFIMEHVDSPAFILHTFKQHLKPGGSIFITVPNSQALNKRIGFEAGLLNDFTMLSDADVAFGHKRLFTVDSLRALIERQGLTVKQLEGLFLKPITTKQIHELRLSEEILQAMLRVGIDYPELCVGILAQVTLDS